MQHELQSTLNSLLSVTKYLCDVVPSSEPEVIVAALNERQQILDSMENNRIDFRNISKVENPIINEMLAFNETLCYLLDKKKNDVSSQIAILKKRRQILNYRRQEAL